MENDNRYTKDFEKISQEVAEIFNIEHIIYDEDYKFLINIDYFEAIDKCIIQTMVENLTKGTIYPNEIFEIISQRRTMKWYKQFENLYQAIWFAAAFIKELNDNATFEVYSIGSGIDNYVKKWHKIDQYYRKFLYNLKTSGQVSGFEKLLENIENLYSNKYLLNLNDSWQQQLNKKRFGNLIVLIGNEIFIKSMLQIANPSLLSLFPMLFVMKLEKN